MKRANLVISVLSGVLVLFIAGSAFLLSFDALEALSEGVGISSERAWLYPAIIDGAVIVFSLSVLRANLNQEKTLYPWLLVSLFIVVSVALNIIHAPHNLLAQFMSAIPPIALFLSFELLMTQMKAIVQRVQTAQSLNDLMLTSENKRAELDALIADRRNKLDELTQKTEQIEEKRTSLSTELKNLRDEKRDAEASSNGSIEHARQVRVMKKQAAMNHLLSYLADHPNASLSEMAAAIGRSKSTAGVYVSELKRDGVLSKNGQGWTISEKL